MKKLNEKEMETVAGGYASSMSREEIDRHKGAAVDKYDGIEGNTYVFEKVNNTTVIVGKLVRTFEDEREYGSTVRMHEVQINAYIDSGCWYSVGESIRLNGDEYQIYEYID